VKGLLAGKMPDITPAQVIALVLAGVPLVLTIVGVHLAPSQLAALDDLRNLGLGLFGADAVIRTGRNYRDARITAAALMPVEPEQASLMLAAQHVEHVPFEMPSKRAEGVADEGGIDDEERGLLAQLDAGVLPPDHEEFGAGEEPESRRVPDDPDRG
jgi:hypothetical protein